MGDIPGLGFILLVALILIIGFIGSSFIAQPITQRFNKLLAKIPLIKVIYDAVKELLSAFVGNQKKFTEPVMFKETDHANVYKIGFITQKDLSELTQSKGLYAVYLPHAYALSGMVVFVESSKIEALNIPSSQAMKFIISGGVIHPKELVNGEEI